MIALRTLGTVDLRKDGMVVSTVLAQPKRLALLAYLASARPRGFVSRETLLALFWPEADGERARNSLRQALHHLRRSLGDAALPGRGDREVGVDAELLDCDAAAFDQAIGDERWEEALGLFRGEFLPGFYVQDAPEAERWIEDERARRRRDAVTAAWRLADLAERAGHLESAERWARRATELEPSDEAGVRRLMALVKRAGDPAGAIAVFDAFARRLRQDYELEPSPETLAVVEGARASAAAIPQVALQPRAPLYGPPPARSMSGEVELTAGPPAAATGAALASLPEASRRARRARWLTWPRAAVVITLVIVAALATRTGLRGRPQAAEAAREPSIAVLPFINLSGDPANEYFSDGISEELLNLLAQLPELQVAARTSSFTYKGHNVPVDSIGRALRVRHVLEGSVRQSGDSVRITAQLIDAKTGYHLWSGNFDRRLADVFQVQDSIGRAIVDLLRPRLTTSAAGPAFQRREARDPRAHVAVLKGWRAFRQNTREGHAAAAEHFAEAIRLDPGYGRAYAGLATVRNWQANLRYIPAEQGYAQAESLAHRALALDSTLSEANVVLGFIAEARDQDFDVAEAHYAAAQRANPSDARAFGRRASLLARLGRADEAIASAQHAVELDPASPAVYADLATVYATLNRFHDSELALRSALALDPGHPILSQNLANALTMQERFADAAEVMAAARRRAPDDVNTMGTHAYVLARAGNVAYARALVDSAARIGLSLVAQASIHQVLGDTDQVFVLLNRALKVADDRLFELLDSTFFGELSTDARMRRIRSEVRGLKLERPR